MALERAFVRAGGMLVAGTDPTGGGGVIPGFSNQRALELLVEAGFTPARSHHDRHAERRAATSVARRRSERSRSASRPIWSCSTAIRRATIADIRKVDTVFRQGVGYDPAKLDRLGHRPRRALVSGGAARHRSLVRLFLDRGLSRSRRGPTWRTCAWACGTCAASARGRAVRPAARTDQPPTTRPSAPPTPTPPDTTRR